MHLRQDLTNWKCTEVEGFSSLLSYIFRDWTNNEQLVSFYTKN